MSYSYTCMNPCMLVLTQLRRSMSYECQQECGQIQGAKVCALGWACVQMQCVRARMSVQIHTCQCLHTLLGVLCLCVGMGMGVYKSRHATACTLSWVHVIHVCRYGCV